MRATAKAGHPRFPTWHSLWAQINRRADRLDRIYPRAERIESTGHLEDEVDALLLCIAHLHDWMRADRDLSQSVKAPVKKLTGQDPLKLAHDYANTFKHHTYRKRKDDEPKPPRRYARLKDTSSHEDGGETVSLQIWM